MSSICQTECRYQPMDFSKPPVSIISILTLCHVSCCPFEWDVSLLKSQMKRLSLQVHADKCSSQYANDWFQLNTRAREILGSISFPLQPIQKMEKDVSDKLKVLGCCPHHLVFKELQEVKEVEVEKIITQVGEMCTGYSIYKECTQLFFDQLITGEYMAYLPGKINKERVQFDLTVLNKFLTNVRNEALNSKVLTDEEAITVVDTCTVVTRNACILFMKAFILYAMTSSQPNTHLPLQTNENLNIKFPNHPNGMLMSDIICDKNELYETLYKTKTKNESYLLRQIHRQVGMYMQQLALPSKRDVYLQQLKRDLSISINIRGEVRDEKIGYVSSLLRAMGNTITLFTLRLTSGLPVMNNRFHHFESLCLDLGYIKKRYKRHILPREDRNLKNTRGDEVRPMITLYTEDSPTHFSIVNVGFTRNPVQDAPLGLPLLKISLFTTQQKKQYALNDFYHEPMAERLILPHFRYINFNYGMPLAWASPYSSRESSFTVDFPPPVYERDSLFVYRSNFLLYTVNEKDVERIQKEKMIKMWHHEDNKTIKKRKRDGYMLNTKRINP